MAHPLAMTKRQAEMLVKLGAPLIVPGSYWNCDFEQSERQEWKATSSDLSWWGCIWSTSFARASRFRQSMLAVSGNPIWYATPCMISNISPHLRTCKSSKCSPGCPEYTRKRAGISVASEKSCFDLCIRPIPNNGLWPGKFKLKSRWPQRWQQIVVQSDHSWPTKVLRDYYDWVHRPRINNIESTS